MMYFLLFFSPFFFFNQTDSDEQIDSNEIVFEKNDYEDQLLDEKLKNDLLVQEIENRIIENYSLIEKIDFFEKTMIEKNEKISFLEEKTRENNLLSEQIKLLGIKADENELLVEKIKFLDKKMDENVGLKDQMSVLENKRSTTSRVYLELLKRCLLNTIYEDPNMNPHLPLNYDAALRENGGDWPLLAHSLIGKKRLSQVEECVHQVLKDEVPGDLVNVGTWRGGTGILMRGCLKAYGDDTRNVWVFDTFEGVPAPNGSKYPIDAPWVFNVYKELAVSLEQVRLNFSKYDLLDDNTRFVKGLYAQTLPSTPINKISVLCVFGFLYELTMDVLVNLYSNVSPGGYVIINDFSLPTTQAAVNNFRNAYQITDPIHQIDSVGIYWQKNN